MKIEKGSKEWEFFMDFWKLVQDYWGCEFTEKYWDKHISDVCKLGNKYPIDTKIGRFARRILMATSDFLEEENKRAEKEKGSD